MEQDVGLMKNGGEISDQFATRGYHYELIGQCTRKLFPYQQAYLPNRSTRCLPITDKCHFLTYLRF